MLNKIFKFLKNKEAVLDAANVILGLFMLTALVVFWKTGSSISMYGIIFAGGAMNLCNGYRYFRQGERRNLGYSMILLGVVVLIMGIFLMLV